MHLLVDRNIEYLDRNEETDVPAYQSYKYLVADKVIWLVVGSINLSSHQSAACTRPAIFMVTYVGPYDVRYLNAHVVQRARNSPCSHRPGVTTGKRNNYRVEIWLSVEKRGQNPGHPVIPRDGQGQQRDEKR